MRRLLLRAIPICSAILIGSVTLHPAGGVARGEARYRIEAGTSGASRLQRRFTDSQLALLEKLNRADVGHLAQLPELVVPLTWDDEL